MVLTSFSDLAELLKRNGLAQKSDPASGRAIVPVRTDRLSCEMAVIWEADTQVIQTVLPLPFAVPDDSVAAAESAIAWINHGLKLPGFGLDHSGPTLYFRLSFPRHADGSFDEVELQHMVTTTIGTAEDFLEPLRGVVESKAPPESALAEAERLRAARSSNGKPKNGPPENPPSAKLEV